MSARTTADKRTPVLVSACDIGVAHGCIGLVRRARDRRIIHRTEAPRPYGFRHEARGDAKEWAIAHGYLCIEEERL